MGAQGTPLQDGQRLGQKNKTSGRLLRRLSFRQAVILRKLMKISIRCIQRRKVEEQLIIPKLKRSKIKMQVLLIIPHRLIQQLTVMPVLLGRCIMVRYQRMRY